MKWLDKFVPYKGELDVDQVVQGMNAAISNGQRLLHDAEILLEAGSYPSAACLAILSIEESGKLAVLRGMSVVNSKEELKDGWKSYRNHKSKNGMWIFLNLIKKGAEKLADFGDVVKANGDHNHQLDAMKQMGFYTDFIEGGVCISPEEVIGKEWAEYLILIARMLSKNTKISKREIELWVHHMKPACSNVDMETAIIAWAEDMSKEGLGGYERMEYFVKGGKCAWKK